jgi:hypothetical protein
MATRDCVLWLRRRRLREKNNDERIVEVGIAPGLLIFMSTVVLAAMVAAGILSPETFDRVVEVVVSHTPGRAFITSPR